MRLAAVLALAYLVTGIFFMGRDLVERNPMRIPFYILTSRRTGNWASALGFTLIWPVIRRMAADPALVLVIGEPVNATVVIRDENRRVTFPRMIVDFAGHLLARAGPTTKSSAIFQR